MSNAYRSVLASGGVAPTGDAVEANVLSGKTFSNALGTGKTGSMTNNGAVSQTIAPGASYTIPEGYHNGSGVVSASQGLDSLFWFSGDSYTSAIVNQEYLVKIASSGTPPVPSNVTGFTVTETVATGTDWAVYLGTATSTTIGHVAGAWTIDVVGYNNL